VREVRQRWAELGRDDEMKVGRIGTLWLTCKNPKCRAEMKTTQQASEVQRINCKPIPITCPYCDTTYEYEGVDLQLKLDD
jgi:aspartate carbamoyltransferase regulatory subunit